MLNQKIPRLSIFFLILFSGTITLAACSLPLFGSADQTPTLNATQAYGTVYAKLTEAVAQTPSPTSGSFPTITPVRPATMTQGASPATPTRTTIPATPAPQCNLAAPGNPIDVTIPDNTQMAPGQAFTKIWRLQNVGECTWNTNYGIVFSSGEQMSAPNRVPLSQSVSPGGSIDISVNLIAPQTAGFYQGDWKLVSDTGFEFGIGTGGSDSFWVRIEVLNLPTQSPTVTPSTPTATSTPGTGVSGSVNLLPGNRVDLDSGVTNSGPGDDLSYENVAQGVHQIKMLGSSRIGVYGENRPEFINCSSSTPNATFINVEAISPGTYMCYLTGLGSIGRARIIEFNTSTAALSLEILTWIK